MIMKKPLKRKSPLKPEQKSKIYMPIKKSTTKPLPKRNQNILKKIHNDIKQPRRHKKFEIPKQAIIVLLILLLGGILFGAVEYISYLRNYDNKEKEQQYIVGLTNIPAYPDSTFIFQGSMDQESVKSFLSKGGSAYRLPSNTSTNDVFEYYKEKLPNLGWTFVQFVSMEVQDKEYGQYWTKDNIGLRIYSKYSDIWYETITNDQAQSGLADRVQEETNLELLLADNDAQDLLPDFPWVLSIPKEYLISYKVSSYNDNLQQVSFSKIGAEEKVYLVPVCSTGTKALDYCLDDYVASLNSSSKEKWSVQNTFVIATNLGAGLKGTITSASQTDEIVIIPDSYNNVAYVVDSNITENTFVDYILANIKPQNTKKY